ncbi:MAG: PLP-dependent aspartate aminotransferase family protein [Gammaproteobacteria bacterium]|nr:PLP-dependent aspartate aminotransferase family protein [Gammaproteobacteria bacterium]MDE0453795.1 PLP-dependent aspartate aminotransferase family protein [Gammaproteobacteria bacterium]
MSKKQGNSTRCVHAGDTHDAATGGVMPAIHQSSTFAYPAMREQPEHIYTRLSNPTRNAFERALNELEAGAATLAFSSGQAASSAVLELLEPGDHIIGPANVYGGSFNLLRVAGKSRFEVSYVHQDEGPEALKAAWRGNTRLVWMETPSNPLLRITDLEALSALCAERGALSCVDSTLATPLATRPLSLGCDISMHSITKYVAGHSDVLGGALSVAAGDLAERLTQVRTRTGGVLAPLDSYLALRGLKTMELRVRRQFENAGRIARGLRQHEKVAQVYYPGLEDHPQHELAKRQMDGFGAVVSLHLHGDEAAPERLLNALELFTIAESLGGVESLAGFPPLMSHSAMTPEAREAAGITGNLVRLSCGIEDADDLIADLHQALHHV